MPVDIVQKKVWGTILTLYWGGNNAHFRVYHRKTSKWPRILVRDGSNVVFRAHISTGQHQEAQWFVLMLCSTFLVLTKRKAGSGDEVMNVFQEKTCWSDFCTLVCVFFETEKTRRLRRIRRLKLTWFQQIVFRMQLMNIVLRLKFKEVDVGFSLCR